MNKEQYYIYKDINEVPVGWRRLRGAALSLQQINNIIARAYELGYSVDEAEDSPFLPDYGLARQEFMDRNTIIDGQWATKNG